MVRMPDLHPERPVAAWARGAEAARRSSGSNAEMPARLIVDVKEVVAVAAAGLRSSTRFAVPPFALLALVPRVIVGV